MKRDLLEYCSSSRRVCPRPQAWQQLYDMLPNKQKKPTGGWMPALPPILAAWHFSTDLEKKDRLHEHLDWAASQSVIAEVEQFIRALPEDQWFHGDD